MDNLKETMERVRDTAKETRADVEAIEVANRVQESTTVIGTSISNQFSTLKMPLSSVNILSYFL
ncbi:hypothetical protein H5410_046804, partial [Solanum commersonii]